MKIQVFSQYYKMAQEGKVNFLFCPKHKDDYEIFNVRYELMHKEENDSIVLYCINCGYNQTAGLQLYENLIEKIKEVENARA
jgi:hypothetical protein